MTATVATKAQPHVEAVKFKEIAKFQREDGWGYRVIAYPSRNRGWSDFPKLSMFVQGTEDDVAEMADLLGTVPENTVVRFKLTPGPLKHNKDHTPKADDGTLLNYFWNVVGIVDVAGQPVIGGGEAAAAQEFEDLPSARADGEGSRTGEGIRRQADNHQPPQEEQPKPPTEEEAELAARRKRNLASIHASNLEPTNLRISVAWAIGQARESLEFKYSLAKQVPSQGGFWAEGGSHDGRSNEAPEGEAAPTTQAQDPETFTAFYEHCAALGYCSPDSVWAALGVSSEEDMLRSHGTLRAAYEALKGIRDEVMAGGA